MNDHLHIVCLDAPSPPDYGGAIDMYYKIQALAKSGKKVILHYFDYNPLRNANQLQQYCHSIYAYKRKPFFKALPGTQPFIIQSRVNNDLINRLNEDVYPVLLEGLHCSGIIPLLNNKERVIIRMHNEEASYYRHLAKTETSFLKKKYFIQESRLLKKYQQTLDKQLKLACLSETDLKVFKEEYSFSTVDLIPCFIPWQQLNIKTEKGAYCLYHGNMTVSENEEAALYLIQNVFSQLDIPFIIAGKGISKKLTREAAKHKNVSLINHPSIKEIDELISNAQINTLPSMNNTGVKLKLLNALFNGRFCFTNDNGIKGSRINESVVVVNSPADWIIAIKQAMQKNFTETDIKERIPILDIYNNKKNAEKLNALWMHYLSSGHSPS